MNTKTPNETELIKLYQSSPESEQGHEAAAKVLSQYTKLLEMIARQAAKQYSSIGEYGDFIQYARIGALTSLKNFDVNAGVKFITYLTRCVRLWIIDCVDNAMPIRCPSQMRPMRSYINGKYDNQPNKKEEFEKKNNIRTDSDREAVTDKYALLSPKHISIDDTGNFGVSLSRAESQRLNYNYESDLIDKLEIDLIKKRLSPKQLDILQCWAEEGHTMSETARLLHMNINEVRLNVRAIRSTFMQAGADLFM